LNRVPADARIAVVTESRALPDSEVRERFKRVKPLKDIPVTQRGWTLDVLNVAAAVCDRRKFSGAHRAPLQSWKDLSRLGSGERNLAESKGPRGPSERARASQFSTSDVYAFEPELAGLHPDNGHVKDKIRQQLQELRDRNLLLHIGRNCWRLP
jgi:hypothetical protein